MSISKVFFWVLLLGFVSGSLSAAIYKTVDENGNVVYTDAPGANSRPVELPPASTYSPPSYPPAKTPEASAKPSEPASRRSFYTRVSVVEPEAEGTIRENTGKVDVRVAVEPELIKDAGHRLQFYLDGVPMGSPSTETETSFSNVDRGEHQVEAAVVDFTGAELKRSDSVRFFLHRFSTLLNPAP